MTSEFTSLMDAFLARESWDISSYYSHAGTRHGRLLHYSQEVARLNPHVGGPVLFEVVAPDIEPTIGSAQKSLRMRGIPWTVFPERVANRTGIRVLEVVDTEASAAPYIRNQVLRVRLPGGRKDRYMLVGADDNEMGWNVSLYFACFLPSGEVPTSVSHAKEMLKPLPVKIAEANGRQVKRQGDLFAIPMDERPKGTPVSNHRLFGTSHVAARAIIRGRLAFAQNHITHEPIGRTRDHGPLYLGDQWHLIVRNTVPQAARRR
jgi:hypothetical protein